MSRMAEVGGAEEEVCREVKGGEVCREMKEEEEEEVEGDCGTMAVGGRELGDRRT